MSAEVSVRWAVVTGATDGTACDSSCAYVFGDESAWALALDSGAVRWSVPAPHSNGVVQSSVLGGAVVAAFESDVHAFDTAAGEVIDEDADDSALTTPGVVTGRGLKAAGGVLTRSVSGEVGWSIPFDKPTSWAIASGEFTIVTGMTGTDVLAADGTRVLSVAVAQPMFQPGPPVPVRDGVVLTDSSGTTICINIPGARPRRPPKPQRVIHGSARPGLGHLPGDEELAERFTRRWRLPRTVWFGADPTGVAPRDADLAHDLELECLRRAEALGDHAEMVFGPDSAAMLLFGHHFRGTPPDQRIAAAGLVLDMVRLMSEAGVVVSELRTPVPDREDEDIPPLAWTDANAWPPLTMDDWLVWVFLDSAEPVPSAEVLNRIEGCGVLSNDARALGYQLPIKTSVTWMDPPRDAVLRYAERVLAGKTRWRLGTSSLTVRGDATWSVAVDSRLLLSAAAHSGHCGHRGAAHRRSVPDRLRSGREAVDA